MNLKVPFQNSYYNRFQPFDRKVSRNLIAIKPVVRTLKSKSNRIFISNCNLPSNQLSGNNAEISPVEEYKEEIVVAVEKTEMIEQLPENDTEELSENERSWAQVVKIAKFSAPAVALWICGPLMSLIDIVVIGQGSSIELAALVPGAVFCDFASYVFMFLSVATLNTVATSLAKQDKKEVQNQISIMLFVGLVSGFLLLIVTRCFAPRVLTAFVGKENAEILIAANTYVQIRGLACVPVLTGWVTQSASLAMKDSWGPFRALAVASVINGIGDIVLCRYLGYGIVGAAWSTMASQVVAAYMMMKSLNNKGYNGFAISIASLEELIPIFYLAAPVISTVLTKVGLYSLLVTCVKSMDMKTVAANQVMIQLYVMCAVFSEPLSQAAQSFMPELINGANQNIPKARALLKSFVIIGVLSGLILGFIGTAVPWLFPKMFSSDPGVIQQMHKVLIPYFLTLVITPSVHSLEGTFLVGYGDDLVFVGVFMSFMFHMFAFFMMSWANIGTSLVGYWFILAGFQWSRFWYTLRWLILPNAIFHSEESRS